MLFKGENLPMQCWVESYNFGMQTKYLTWKVIEHSFILFCHHKKEYG
jgi:hypothetical protein